MNHETHRLIVPRTARYLTLGSIDDDLGEVWFLLHGYGQLASEFLDSARALARSNRLLVVPEALSRFYHEDHERIGASWMTREERLSEIEDYIRYLDLLYARIFELVPPSRASARLLGFSQGVATATRWACRGKTKIDHLVCWGSAIPPELDDEASVEPLKSLRLTLVGGTRDPFLTQQAREEQASRLRRYGVGFDELTFEGGHRLDDDTLRRLAERTDA